MTAKGYICFIFVRKFVVDYSIFEKTLAFSTQSKSITNTMRLSRQKQLTCDSCTANDNCPIHEEGPQIGDLVFLNSNPGFARHGAH